VAFEQDRCLHAIDRSSTCQVCRDLCPTGAIQGYGLPHFDDETCVACRACVTACPVGAYGVNGSPVPLFDSAALRGPGAKLDLVCASHPQAGTGPTAESVGCRVGGCLAGLGAGTYLSLVALGAERVWVRLDACRSCPQGGLEDHIRRQVDRARSLLALWHKDDVVLVVNLLETPVPRPLRHAASRRPEMSRRDLFRMFSLRPRDPEPQPETPASARPAGQMGDDRAQILGAVDRFSESLREPSASLEGLGFASLTVSERCTGCLACVRACPAKAIRFFSDNGGRVCRLDLLPRACIGCGACAHVCRQSAIAIDHAPLAEQVFGSREPVVLWEGEMTCCEHCQALFPARPGARLCPLCDFRSSHPFGSARPHLTA
jgi:ferredoxin